MLLKFAVCLLFLLTTINAKRYAIDSDFKVSEIPEDLEDVFLNNDKIVATSSFIDDRNISGWTYYEVQTSASFPDWAQTYSAGFMEGYLAYDLIWDTWINQKNYMKDVQGYDSKKHPEVKEFIKNQTEWMFKMAIQYPNDHYWNLVNATLAQVVGMYQGYLGALEQHGAFNLTISFYDFYTLTYASDLWDVISRFTGLNLKPLKCSFLMRLTNDSLYTSHTTWYQYFGLLRTYKVLNFDLNNPIVQTKRMSFSSQPGYTTSQDDFYILDHNRFVSETSLESNNDEVYSYLHYDSLPYWVRITVANLVFDTQETWVEAYFAFRSGTYNNQWLVVDFNQYNASKDDLSQARNIIWLVEEFYSLTSSQDVTQTMLIPQGYVASYNVPYSPAIEALSKNPTNYTDDPRAILFHKYAPGIQNLDDFKYVMRLNNHSDTGDYCQAIAARCDLEDDSDFPMGALDCKVTSDTMVTTHQAWIIAGPTHENLPPFSWENWPQYNNVRAGIETVSDFDWVFVNPDTNFSSTAQWEDYNGFYSVAI